jgi:hypothetical protein
VTRALDWLAGLEGWRWVLVWVVASVAVSVLAAMAFNSVQPFGFDRDRPTLFRPEDLPRMRLWGALGHVFVVSMVGLAHVPLLRWRILWPWWWPAASGAGALASSLVMFPVQGLSDSAWRPDVAWVWILVPPVLSATARGGIEAFFLRLSVGQPAGVWVVASAVVGFMPALPGLASITTDNAYWNLAEFRVAMGALSFFMAIIPAVAMMRLTDEARDRAALDDEWRVEV